MLTRTTYNPDVLSCLANLSSDEVFTPPGLANQVLDLLPTDLWHNPEARFLDPVCKTGIFLREIAKRLNEGLKDSIPDQQERLNHIYTKQVFGIAITELTSLLARRSLYCSKKANGKYSVCTTFADEQGNVFYPRSSHTWVRGSCKYCGANEDVYYRNERMESYAYPFIHQQIPAEVLAMQFDVIIGNPPYQLSDGGDQSDEARTRGGAIPIYNKFIDQAKKLKPRFLTMIIPSRWFSGGRGLDDFRDVMLNDKRIRHIIDYPVSSECFPGVEIKGGVCYFLWDRDNPGLCEVKTINSKNVSTMSRPLIENGADIFIRFNQAISIFRKVISKKEESFSKIVSTQKPFGFRTYFKGSPKPFFNGITLYGNNAITYIDRSLVSLNYDWIDNHKVYITMAYGAGEDFPHQIINKPFYGAPNTCCTETYVVIGPFVSKEYAENAICYMSTKFFRFLVLLKKNTQHASKNVYSFVPLLNFDIKWTDEELYQKYNLDQNEIDFIESMIRPMELSDGD